MWYGRHYHGWRVISQTLSYNLQENNIAQTYKKNSGFRSYTYLIF